MKLNLISIAVLAALGASTSAHALNFAFDPTGGGALVNTTATTLDQAPGNALALGGSQAVANRINGSGPTTFTLIYQANLSAVQDASSFNLFSNGTGGHFFTFTMGFQEQVLAASNVTNTAVFGIAPGSSYYNMYATTALGDNLTGAGFVNGTPILTGHLIEVSSSNFTATNTTGVTLDQSPNGNQWATKGPGGTNQLTVTGSGSSDLVLKVDSANAGYFPDLPIGTEIVLTAFNTSQVDPYKQVDPSYCFNTDTLTCAANSTGGINGNLGAINGHQNGAPPSLSPDGPDFQFQADANSSFTVPEPGTVALLGLGLGFLGLRSVRRRAA